MWESISLTIASITGRTTNTMYKVHKKVIIRPCQFLSISNSQLLKVSFKAIKAWKPQLWSFGLD